MTEESTSNMDNIESNVAQDLRNTEKTGVASIAPPCPPTHPRDKQQLIGNQQRAETKWGRNGQVAVRAELYKAVHLFAHCLLPIVFILVGGFRAVEVTGMLAILLGVSVVVIVLLLALSCLAKMWLLYREDKPGVPFIIWLKLAYPFYLDLQTISVGSMLLFEMFVIGAVLVKCAKNSTVEWIAE